MSAYPNGTKEDMINLADLAAQQKIETANKNKNRFLEQTHDRKLAETFAPVTEKLIDLNRYTKKN